MCVSISKWRDLVSLPPYPLSPSSVTCLLANSLDPWSEWALPLMGECSLEFAAAFALVCSFLRPHGAWSPGGHTWGRSASWCKPTKLPASYIHMDIAPPIVLASHRQRCASKGYSCPTSVHIQWPTSHLVPGGRCGNSRSCECGYVPAVPICMVSLCQAVAAMFYFLFLQWRAGWGDWTLCLPVCTHTHPAW